MIDQESVERAAERFKAPEDALDRLIRRRDRKRRNQRIAAGSVGIAIFVVAVWIVWDVASLDGTGTEVTPGGSGTTGPTETGAPQVTGVAPPASELPPPASAVGRPQTDYMLDLNTGETTPLPESIVGTEDVTTGYAVSPDGSKLAYVRPGDGGSGQIFVAELDGTRVEQVTTDRMATAPAWSPDGSAIAYLGRRDTGPWNVFVLDLAKGTSTQITFETVRGEGIGWYPTQPTAVRPSFSPDGSSIVYSYGVFDRNGGEVRIVPIAGGESVRLVGGSGLNAGDGELSPDGSLLSYGCGEPKQPWGRCLANADGTDARVLVPWEGRGGLFHARWSPDGTRLAYGRGWDGVFIVDVATGDSANVATGSFPSWLDDHTLIVEADYCNRPNDACPG